MKILAFGAHPDDVEVGMGGTVARHADAGDDITMVVATSFPNNGTDARWEEASEAAEILGCDVELLDLGLDEIHYDRKLVGILDELFESYRPHTVYVPWHYDSHQDHRYLTRAVIAAARKNQESVYMHEPTIPGGIVPQTFQPQRYVDVSETIDRKIESLRAHASQVEKHGERWLDAVRGRAAYRGYEANCDYAEAFQVVKQHANI
jgi:LmbE family N-acetylglucosaminyl deacetylase